MATLSLDTVKVIVGKSASNATASAADRSDSRLRDG